MDWTAEKHQKQKPEKQKTKKKQHMHGAIFHSNKTTTEIKSTKTKTIKTTNKTKRI